MWVKCRVKCPLSTENSVKDKIGTVWLRKKKGEALGALQTKGCCRKEVTSSSAVVWARRDGLGLH